jgi:hypothetical protein
MADWVQDDPASAEVTITPCPTATQWVASPQETASSEPVPEGTGWFDHEEPVSEVVATTAAPLESAPTARQSLVVVQVTALKDPCPGIDPPGMGTVGAWIWVGPLATVEVGDDGPAAVVVVDPPVVAVVVVVVVEPGLADRA